MVDTCIALVDPETRALCGKPLCGFPLPVGSGMLCFDHFKTAAAGAPVTVILGAVRVEGKRIQKVTTSAKEERTTGATSAADGRAATDSGSPI